MLALPFALLSALPGLAQDAEVPLPPPAAGDDTGAGLDLMQEGARQLLRGLMREVEPQMDEMGKALDEMGQRMGEALDSAQPWVTGLMALVDDIGNYEAPELLPNGDIVIRRKPDAPALPVEKPSAGEVEL